MKIETMYERKGKRLKDLATGKTKTFKFINEAKRESWLIQKANGGLGMGSVVNIT